VCEYFSSSIVSYRPVARILECCSAVASLGLVSPGATTEGVCHPCFSCKKLTTFLLITVTIIYLTRVSPLRVCHPHLFYLSDLVCPLFFVNLPTKNFLCVQVSPLGGCHPGQSASRLVTPLLF